MSAVELRERIQQLHDAAVAAGEPYYTDPISGFLVMTAEYLDDLGVCCDKGCRHCPFGCAQDDIGPGGSGQGELGRPESA